VSKQGAGHKEFKVRIDVELPEEARDRIERAIQKAVLNELADTDLADGYSVVMRAPANADDPTAAAAERSLLGGRSELGLPDDVLGGSGGTDGIWIREDRSIL